MSEPQLRCLLCDLILADASTAGRPTERCKQCGRDVLAGQAAAAEPIPLQPLGTKEPITVIDDLPEATVEMAKSDDIPTASVAKPSAPPTDVPTVQPRPRTQSSAVPPSLARRGAEPRATQKPIPPVRRNTAPDLPKPLDRPRPKIIVALGVLGCMGLLVVVCLAVIAYSILYGLQKARKVEAPASPRPAFSVPG